MSEFFNNREIKATPPRTTESGRKKWGTVENCKKLSCAGLKKGGAMRRGCERVCERIFRD